MSWQLYDMIEARAQTSEKVRMMLLGLNWSVCRLEHAGLCFSPSAVPRTLPWPGTLVGREGSTLLPWLRSYDPAQAAIAVCVANAAINTSANRLLARAGTPRASAPGHLRVFAELAPKLSGASVTVIGRYPGLDALWSGVSYRVIERQPYADTLPDAAAEYELPRSDWVFITGSALANKTLPRLLALSQAATVVLLGPSVPWLEDWGELGVRYVAGVTVKDPDLALQVAAEGGGTRLFDEAVEYRLAEL